MRHQGGPGAVQAQRRNLARQADGGEVGSDAGGFVRAKRSAIELPMWGTSRRSAIISAPSEQKPSMKTMA